MRSAYGVNTEHSTDGAGTECVRSEYGAQYGRSGYGVRTENTEHIRTERVQYGVNTRVRGVGTEHIWSGYGADQRWSWGSGGE